MALILNRVTPTKNIVNSTINVVLITIIIIIITRSMINLTTISTVIINIIDERANQQIANGSFLDLFWASSGPPLGLLWASSGLPLGLSRTSRPPRPASQPANQASQPDRHPASLSDPESTLAKVSRKAKTAKKVKNQYSKHYRQPRAWGREIVVVSEILFFFAFLTFLAFLDTFAIVLSGSDRLAGCLPVWLADCLADWQTG